MSGAWITKGVGFKGWYECCISMLGNYYFGYANEVDMCQCIIPWGL